MTPPFTDISCVLQDYFDGLYNCDTGLLSRVFHPHAVYATGDETPALIRSMEDYFAVVAARVSPASKGQVRRDVIETIKFAGENTAFARVRCSIGARDYVDFLTLIREDGSWRIIAKVFQIIPHTD